MDSPRITIFDTTLRDGEQSPGCSMNVQEKVRLARQLDRLGVDVEFSPEDATRTEPEFLFQVLEAVIQAGATTLNIPDTVGYTVPAEFGELIRNIRERVRGVEGVTISTHCHNDLGLAVANSLVGVANGARQVECTINGIGERAGNASLEEIVMSLRVRADRYPYQTSVASEELYPTSQLLEEITGIPVQPNKAIIGRNAFAHEAGIHQDGMLKNRLTYEIMTPQSVGVPDSKLVLGKHSGRHALSLRCEQLGYHFERRELDEVYRKVVLLADQIKNVQDHHLLQLIREAYGESHRIPPGRVEVEHADAVAAGAEDSRKLFPAVLSDFSAVSLPANAVPDHHAEQEDYLWGV